MLGPLAALVLLAAAPAERTVAIVPLGKVNPAILEAVAKAVTAVADVKVQIETPRDLPKEAWYAPRRRFRAEKILDALDADPPPGAWKVLAVTEAEISTTKGEIYDWGIVGLGNIDSRSAVVSSHIFRKWSRTRRELLRRLADSAVHELGHTLGADHCDSKGCVMRDARGKAITSADSSTGRFCPICRARIEAASGKVLKTSE